MEIEFKSIEPYYRAEMSGLKCNTVREIDLNDLRFQEIVERAKTGYYGEITIKLKGTLQDFTRKISDISFWKNLVIISWENHS